MIIDVLQPTEEEVADGARDPMRFYLDYGFVAFPGDERRLFKPMRTITQEYAEA